MAACSDPVPVVADTTAAPVPAVATDTLAAPVPAAATGMVAGPAGTAGSGWAMPASRTGSASPGIAPVPPSSTARHHRPSHRMRRRHAPHPRRFRGSVAPTTAPPAVAVRAAVVAAPETPSDSDRSPTRSAPAPSEGSSRSSNRVARRPSIDYRTRLQYRLPPAPTTRRCRCRRRTPSGVPPAHREAPRLLFARSGLSPSQHGHRAPCYRRAPRTAPSPDRRT